MDGWLWPMVRSSDMEVLQSRILVRPRDFEVSRAFYRDTLGLHLYREFAGGRGLVFFLGGGFLELSGSHPHPSPSGIAIWLQVRDLNETHDRLVAAGVVIDEPPTKKPWDLHEMRARDPDGLELVFVEIPPDHPLRRDTRA